MDGKTLRRLGCAAGLIMSAALAQPAMARETGLGGYADHPGGGTNGGGAGNIPVGIFMVDQLFLDSTKTNGAQGHDAVDVAVFIFNPGWTFLGATTQFIFVQPWLVADNAPINNEGMVNELYKADASWKFGDWHVKLALGAWADVGSRGGPNGLAGAALPFWTIQPEFAVQWAHDGWSFLAYTYWEIDTKNDATNYQNAPLFHADFTLSYTTGKWTFGPVADFTTQVGSDTSSNFYLQTAAGNANCLATVAVGTQCTGGSVTEWDVGATVAYDFGPVTLQLWATDQVYHKLTGNTIAGNGANSVTQSGYTFWFQASYALYTPEEAAPAPSKKPLIYK